MTLYRGIAFTTDYTWRKMGYIFHGDSREFRKVLDANPAWDIGWLPAEGDLIFVENEEFDSTLGRIDGTPITDFAGQSSITNDLTGYPYSTFESLYDRLQDYTNYALDNPDELNGDLIS